MFLLLFLFDVTIFNKFSHSLMVLCALKELSLTAYTGLFFVAERYNRMQRVSHGLLLSLIFFDCIHFWPTRGPNRR